MAVRASSAILWACSTTEGIREQYDTFNSCCGQGCESLIVFFGSASFDNFGLDVEFFQRAHGFAKLDGNIRIV